MSFDTELDATAKPKALGRAEIGPDGGEFTNLQSDAPIKDWDDALRKLGVDPAGFQVVDDSIRVSSWQQSKRTENGDRDVVTLFSYSGRIETRRDRLDLPALYAASRRSVKAPVRSAAEQRVTVVVLSDMQIGKVGSRGGTPELLERLTATRERLAKHLAKVKPTRTVLAESGDGFEGFESGGSPLFTNDLSLSQQIDMMSTEVFEFASVMHRHGHVDVLSAPSNHTGWRNGKQQLGRPGDDLGMLCHRMVEKQAHAAGLDMTWHYSPMYSEAVTLEVLGTTLGMVHGNQYGPGGAPKWWAGQQHGGQPVGSADILVAGHYHHLMVLPTGRNPYTGRAKWFLQAPTLDNASDWYRNRSGDDSDPGLLVFDVTPDGFDLTSLTVL